MDPTSPTELGQTETNLTSLRSASPRSEVFLAHLKNQLLFALLFLKTTSSSFSDDFKIFLSKIYVQYCLSSEVAVSKMKNYVNVNLNLVLLRDTLWMGIAGRKQQHKSISLISKLYWGNFVIEKNNNITIFFQYS